MKYVFYHANCNDGFGAALAAWKRLGKQAKYIPIQYGKEHEAINRSGLNKDYTDVYFLDFTPPTEIIESLAAFHNIYLIDHHVSAMERMGMMATKYPNVYSTYDNEQSGAMLAWKYFWPKSQVPYLYKLIQDRDLWNWRYSNDTVALYNGLTTIPMTFEEWNRLIDETRLKRFINKSSNLQSYADALMAHAISGVFHGELDGKVAGYCFSPLFQSEIANLMLERLDIDVAAVVSINSGTEAKVSLRSRKGEVDVSKVAEKFGGGGHASASGFVTKDLSFIGGLFERPKPKRTKGPSKRKDKAEE